MNGSAVAAVLALAGCLAAAAPSPLRAQSTTSLAGVASAPLPAPVFFDPATPLLIVEQMAALGPRLPSTAAHDQARELLAESLRQLGLAEVRVAATPNGTRNVEGLLLGADPAAGEIVLGAHYDTVEGSPGAADDAAGCAVVLGAIAELRRAPLRRSVRVLFFDGEEDGLLGSEAWIASLAPAQRERILGALQLDVVGIDRPGGPVVLDTGGATLDGGWPRVPAWLVHAALRAGAATGFRFRVGDHRTPLLAQLLTRTAGVPWSSDAAALLEAGIPSLVLTDFSALHPDEAMHTPQDRPERLAAERLARWVDATAALVRRVDALDGRPRWEEEYLAWGGRVWIRRDLLWIGLGLWIVLVFRGRPGRWAGAQTGERRARGRSYLPGYLFRLAFLAAAVWMPSVAALLLYPLAPLGLIAPRTTAGRMAVAAAGTLPAAVWLGLLAVAGALGLATGFILAPGKAVLLALTLTTFAWQLWSRPRATS
jgi:hypothetical protein